MAKQARALARGRHAHKSPRRSRKTVRKTKQGMQPPAPTEEVVPLPDLPATIERLHRAVLEELAAVGKMRMHLKREPQSPADAERTARTLSSLAEILQKLQRLQCAAPQTGPHDDDDIPVDIDEFRKDLARRIDAFVASRTGAGDGSVSAA